MASGGTYSGSQIILGQIFGDWIFGGSLETMFSSFLSLLSVAGLVLYSMIILYIGLAGMIKAAGRGGAISGWHPGWVPFRVLLSLMLVLPLYGGANWSAAQSLLLSITLKGADFADWTVEQLVSNELMKRYFHDANFKFKADLVESQRFVGNAIMAASCIRANQDLNNPNNLVPGSAGYDAWLKKISRRCGLSYDFFTGNLVVRQAAPARAAQASGADKNFQPLPWAAQRENLIKQQEYTIRETVARHNLQWFPVILNHADYIWNTLHQPGLQGFEQRAKNTIAILEAYHETLNLELEKALQNSYQQFANLYAEDMKNKGWWFVFASHRDLIRQTETVQRQVSAAMASMTPEPRLDTAVTKNDQLINMSLAKVAEEESSLWDDFLKWLTGVGDGAKEWGAAQLEKFGQWLMELLGFDNVQQVMYEGKDPLVAMHDMGKRFMMVGSSAIGAKFVGDIGGKIGESVGWSGPGGSFVEGGLGFLDKATELGWYIGVPMLIAGLILFLLSYLPVLYGVSTFMAWIVFIAQSLIAAPLWAAAHAAPAGENHTSNLAAKGYNNILFIILYPALAVAGYVAATLISSAALPTVYHLVWDGVVGSTNGVWTFVSWVWAAVLIVIVSWMVIHLSYQLIETGPAAVLGWISTAEPGHNPFASLAQRGNQTMAMLLWSRAPGGVGKAAGTIREKGKAMGERAAEAVARKASPNRIRRG